MEDLTLVREYRPNNLRNYVTTPIVANQVRLLLNQKNKPHFIMISGASGLGKTTLARIIAKDYRCLRPNGQTCNAQGLGGTDACASCQAFDLYIKTGKVDNIRNLAEVDTGHYSRTEDIRDLLTELNMADLNTGLSGTKIVILDEVQALSYHAQDALLKQLEEPDEDILTIMCTTRIDRIQPTIVSRAEYSIKLLPPRIKDLSLMLKTVAQRANIKGDSAGFMTLATRYNDRIRNAVQAVQNIDNIDHMHGVTLDNVQSYLEQSTVSPTELKSFLEGILSRDNKIQSMGVMHNVRTKSDFDTFLHELTEYVKRGLYIVTGSTPDGVLDNEVQTYKSLFSKFSIDQLSILLDRLRQARIGDIEINLISLIYSGLQNEILPIAKEKQKEESNRATNLEDIKQVEQTRAKEEMSSLDEEVTADDLLSRLQ